MLISIGRFACFSFELLETVVEVVVMGVLCWLCFTYGLVVCVGALVFRLLWWVIWFCVVVMFDGWLRLCCGLFSLILL